MSLRRIGILTSGGDCSGLNSIIRAAYIRAKTLGYELFGIKRGLKGLLTDPPEYVALNDDICNDSMLTTAGSIIYSDTRAIKESGRSVDEIKSLLRSGYKKLALDGLICIGGDGSLKIVSELLICNGQDLNVVSVPKTIDNDVNYTDLAIGFQTSVEVAVNAVDNITSTARSHERAIVVEVMGRGAGFIAMNVGIASGADVILVPEFKYDIEKVKAKVKSCFSSGKGYCILIVAESVEADDFKHDKNYVDDVVKYTQITYKGIARHIANEIKETGIESRYVKLGHVQRGGKTSINDRLLGSMFGVEAVNLINNHDYGKLLCYVNNKIETIDIKTAVKNPNKTLSKDDPYVNIAKQLGVYVGEI
ncbi:MAG: ATP-dependent 6-phosphofructokinase [Holosporales bacterium]|jgi:6-phosphofructokinase 1|nr:ATP-dependent 6-phosphofructokinase [Holosporales bacterium]